MVSLRMSAGLNSAFALLLNDILLPAGSTSTGMIPIEIYTVTKAGVLLEAFVFEDILTPYTATATSLVGTVT